MINTAYPNDLLKAFENMEIKESYVKIELLNWQEEIIQEIQGVVSGGSVSFDGKSSMRRTCNFTITVPADNVDYNLSELINLNKKFNLYIGYTNKLADYQDYGKMLWFKIGVFVFISANFTHSLSSTSISITARDKMCLLNGSIQGTFPQTVILHNRYTNEGKLEPIPIKEIIRELIHHYGKEPLQNIFINDVPDYGRMLVKYIGIDNIYLTKTSEDKYTGNISKTQTSEYDELIKYGDIIGYRKVPFVYPGELIGAIGDSITSALDKICATFGNFEYFYDIHGRFIFQEKKNYLNNSFVPFADFANNNYEINQNNNSNVLYSFKENNLISSYSNSPKWENIKNDFVVWGNKITATGGKSPIHYHLAIDTRPIDGNIPYQIVQYNRDKAIANAELQSDYAKDLLAFFGNQNIPMVDDIDNAKDWATGLLDHPETLNYWLEILEDKGKYAKYSVQNIGRRTYAIEDDNITCLYPPNVPAVVFVEEGTDVIATQVEFQSSETFNGYQVIEMPSDLSSAIVSSTDIKSCYDVVREALYQKLSLQETITIQTIPIYWLEPNNIIEVEDSRSNIYGNYIITTILLPLTYNGLMSITAIRADVRI